MKKIDSVAARSQNALIVSPRESASVPTQNAPNVTNTSQPILAAAECMFPSPRPGWTERRLAVPMRQDAPRGRAAMRHSLRAASMIGATQEESGNVGTKVIAPIQALRGIAASMVLLWHASRYVDGVTLARFLQPGAAMGVDLFFLVSGFIMVHTTRDSDGSPRYVAEFLVKRAARIWPLWLLALAVMLVVQGDSTYFTDASRCIWLLRSVVFVPTPGVLADVPPIFGAPVLGVGWTLNYEMYFYAFFGLSMLAGRWRWAAFASWVVASVMLLPLIGGKLDGLAHPLDFLDVDRNYGYTVQYLDLATSPLVLLFVVGALIGLMHHSRVPALPRGVAIASIGLAVAIVAAQFAFAFRPYHGVGQWGLSLIPLLISVSFASRSAELRVPAWLRWLGDISFSLYLLHMIVVGFVFSIVRDHRFAVVAAIAGVLLSFPVAALSHRWIELDLSGGVRRWALARMGSPEGRAADRITASGESITRSST